MTIDPLVIIAAITALGGLLLEVIRRFLNGDLLSKHAVPRADYDRVLAINEGYALKFGEQTASVNTMAGSVDRLATMVERSVK